MKASEIFGHAGAASLRPDLRHCHAVCAPLEHECLLTEDNQGAGPESFKNDSDCVVVLPVQSEPVSGGNP